MKIASLSENIDVEKRIAITPDTAKKFKSLNFEISLPSNYGNHLGFSDNEYKDKLASLVSSSISRIY